MESIETETVIPSPAAHLIFVYGTLRQGERNHGLLRGARFWGAHRTAPVYTLLDLGSYPGAVVGGCTALVGELYGVDGKLLCDLDVLEDHPRLYIRERMTTPHGLAWIYLYQHPVAGMPVIVNGDWCDWRRGRGAAIPPIGNPNR